MAINDQENYEYYYVNTDCMLQSDLMSSIGNVY